MDLICCALKSQTNVYRFRHNDQIEVEIDKNGCNIKEEQKKRCNVTERLDYNCIHFKDLQKADIGSFDVEMAGSDGVIHKMLLLNITEDDLNYLRNACHFKTNFTHLSNRIYCGKAETELSDDLRRALNNGTKIFSAMWLPDCNPPTEDFMNVPPKGTDAPPTREQDIRILIYCVAVAVVLGLVIAVICCTRKSRSKKLFETDRLTNMNRNWEEVLQEV